MFLWFSGCHHAPTRTNTMAGSLLVLTGLLLGVIPSQTACMWGIGVLRCTALHKSIKQSSKRSKAVKQHTCHMATLAIIHP